MGQRVWDDNLRGYGARKVWKQPRLEGEGEGEGKGVGEVVARFTLGSLMRTQGAQGARRGQPFNRTTIAGERAPQPPDLVHPAFRAIVPNERRVADFTDVATWMGFVNDVASRRILGWRVSKSMRTDLAQDALEQAIHLRPRIEKLVHHSDRGSQYLSIRYTDTLAECGIESSVGTSGDSYADTLAESVIGLFKAEVIWHREPEVDSRRSILRRSAGSTGSTTVACSKLWAAFLQRNSSNRTTRVGQPTDSSHRASEDRSAVHSS